MAKKSLEHLEEVLSIGEAAKIAGVAPSTVRQYIKDGKVRGRKSGRIWLVDKESLLEAFALAGKPKRSTASKRGVTKRKPRDNRVQQWRPPGHENM